MASVQPVSAHVPLPAETAPANRASDWPEVKDVDVSDIPEILALAANDIRRAPAISLFFGIVYAIAGLALGLLMLQNEVPYLIYPMAMGFALIAPFFAAGLYDISRRLEVGEPVTWGGVFSSIRHTAGRDLRWMAFVTAFVFIIWMDIAAMLTFAFMGFSATSLTEFVREVFTTPNGVLFLVVGNVVGAVIALSVFAISVVSFPMLYDRDIDFVTAMVTSVRLVLHNKKSMFTWAMTIAWILAASVLSGFVGLIFALPLLGHATWHLYRRSVAQKAITHAA
jgi:uncharacterized membrane protein